MWEQDAEADINLVDRVIQSSLGETISKSNMLADH
jgi:hypothetical protein